MCGVHESLKQIDASCLKIPHSKRENHDLRKEKSRDAARCRRSKESDYFQMLADLLPVSGTPPNSQMTSIDKTSLIRLSVAYLKSRDFIGNCGINISQIKEECSGEIDILEVVNGFSLVLNQVQDVVHVSNNVSDFIGLTSFELLGQPLTDFIHPCDHAMLRDLLPTNIVKDTHVKAYLRIKCTITDRGRLINLKQANYKALKLEGHARRLDERDEGGVSGVVFMGVGTLVSSDMSFDTGIGVFTTKHTRDLKFAEADDWLTQTGGYSLDFLQDRSLYQLIHAEDTNILLQAFGKLEEHGHCETDPYRLLVGGGGYVWIQTKAGIQIPRRGSNKGTTVTCRHMLLTEVLDIGEILDLVQIEGRKSSSTRVSKARKTTKASPQIYAADEEETTESMREILNILDEEKKELDIVAPVTPVVYEDLLTLQENCEPQTYSPPAPPPPIRSSVIVSPASAPTFKAQSCPTAVTAQLFSFAEEDPATEEEKASNKENFSDQSSPYAESGSDCDEKVEEVSLKNLFGDFGPVLGPELEKFSPFIGDECIALNKQDEYGFTSLELESFDDLEFPDDDFNFNANTEKLFSQADYDFEEEKGKEGDMILGLQTDIMWGGSQSVGCSEEGTPSSLSPASSLGNPGDSNIHNLNMGYSGNMSPTIINKDSSAGFTNPVGLLNTVDVPRTSPTSSGPSRPASGPLRSPPPYVIAEDDFLNPIYVQTVQPCNPQIGGVETSPPYRAAGLEQTSPKRKEMHKIILPQRRTADSVPMNSVIVGRTTNRSIPSLDPCLPRDKEANKATNLCRYPNEASRERIERGSVLKNLLTGKDDYRRMEENNIVKRGEKRSYTVDVGDIVDERMHKRGSLDFSAAPQMIGDLLSLPVSPRLADMLGIGGNAAGSPPQSKRPREEEDDDTGFKAIKVAMSMPSWAADTTTFS